MFIKNTRESKYVEMGLCGTFDTPSTILIKALMSTIDNLENHKYTDLLNISLSLNKDKITDIKEKHKSAIQYIKENTDYAPRNFIELDGLDINACIFVSKLLNLNFNDQTEMYAIINDANLLIDEDYDEEIEFILSRAKAVDLYLKCYLVELYLKCYLINNYSSKIYNDSFTKLIIIYHLLYSLENVIKDLKDLSK